MKRTAPLVSRSQRGQALVLGLAFIFMAVLVGFHMFNVGQNTAEKLKVTNAADAAAYSGAVWQARSLNYISYTNRAIVANEVAIGQAASVVSWTQYAPHAIESIKNEVWFQVICTYFGFCSAVDEAQTIAEEVAAGVAYVAPADLAARSGIIFALGKSQEAIRLATILGTRNNVIEPVIRANNPTYNLAFTDVGASYIALTKKFEGDERSRMRDVIMDDHGDESSRDKFMTTREMLGFNLPFPPSTNGSPGICIADPLSVPVLKKRGGADMVGLDEWESFDTLSLHYKSNRSFFRCRSNETAYGWGSAQFDSGDDAGEYRHDNSRGTNPRAHAETAGGETSTSRGRVQESNSNTRIPDFFDVDPNGTNGNRSGKASFVLVVSKPGTGIRTANNLNLVEGRLRTGERYAGGNMSALTAAEVYFKRPGEINGGPLSFETSGRRTDGRLEYASLFNPFWQARLASPNAVQAASIPKSGPMGGLDPFTGARSVR